MRRGRGLAIAVGMLLLVSAAADASTPPGQKSLHYGDVVRVAPNTLMVVGRPLDVARGEADIANAISTGRAARCM